MKKRESFTEISAFMIPQDGVLAFFIETVNSDTYFDVPTVIDKRSNVEFIYKKSMGYLKPLGPNKTQMKFLLNCNPQIDYIPNSMLEWGIKTISGAFLSFLANTFTTLPDKHRERLEMHKWKYDSVRNTTSLLAAMYPFSESEDVTNA